MTLESYLDLWDFRRRVSAIYNLVREEGSHVPQVWQNYRSFRDDIFKNHPQSALDQEQKQVFDGLRYYEHYEPSLRFVVPIEQDIGKDVIELPLQDDGVFALRRFGRVEISVHGVEATLSLYWTLGYGGGVFLPFRDATNQTGETYGGGRYLLDTIKGSDLGMEGEEIVLDFNYAYNPSCAYHNRWHCPLAPQENWLKIPIEAGEKAYPSEKMK